MIAYSFTFGSLLALCKAASSSLEIRTTSGTFGGLSVEGGLDRWLGIPFAQPPVGTLRFKAPVPVTQPAPGVKNASEFGNACPQVPADNINAPISEDCLFLNVSALTRFLSFGTDQVVRYGALVDSAKMRRSQRWCGFT